MNNPSQSDSMPYDLQKIANANWASLLGELGEIFFILDQTGVIEYAQISDPDLAELIDDGWTGQSLIDIVSDESKEIVSRMLMPNGTAVEAKERLENDWQNVSIPLSDGEEIPLLLRHCEEKEENYQLIVARDMRTIVSLRQQLLNAQLTVEQDYWRLRMVETRYRTLFQMARDGLVVVDNTTGRVLESNAAANKLLLEDGDKLVGKKLVLGFDSSAKKDVEELIEAIRTNGRADIELISPRRGMCKVNLSGSILQNAEDARILLHIVAANQSGENGYANPSDSDSILGQALKDAPDAAIITDSDGAIVSVNEAFVALAELQSLDQAIGRNLSNWIGKTTIESNVLMTNLKRHGLVKMFTTEIRGEYEGVSEVEISASRTQQRGSEYFLFFIRDVSRRLSNEPRGNHKLPRSVAQITDQIGRIPLKDLVKESTSVIEKLCIESALEMTNNNRASAAELLGLSRQSLYAKLREYGLKSASK